MLRPVDLPSLPEVDAPLSAEEEAAIRAAATKMKADSKEGEPLYVIGHGWQRLLTALAVERLLSKTERTANNTERDQWSRAAEVLGLAPYGGAYNPINILPRIQKLTAQLAGAVNTIAILLGPAPCGCGAVDCRVDEATNTLRCLKCGANRLAEKMRSAP